MSITGPIDILTGFPGWTTMVEPMLRQEQSRSANGKTYVKNLGSPLWQLSAQSRQLKPNELDYWRARLNTLIDGSLTFYGRPMSRCFPIAYPNGSWPTGAAFDGVSASLASVATDRKTITVSSLPVGFIFSVGDYLAVGNDLHQVMEPASANSFGTTGGFEVWPHIWPGVSSGTVSVKKPSCLMAVVPGSVSTPADPQTGWGTVSFQGVEARL